jgi:predicted alpha/beta hydrolase
MSATSHFRKASEFSQQVTGVLDVSPKVSASGVRDVFAEARAAAGLPALAEQARGVHASATASQDRMAALLSRLRASSSGAPLRSQVEDAKAVLRTISQSAGALASGLTTVAEMRAYLSELSVALDEVLAIFPEGGR